MKQSALHHAIARPVGNITAGLGVAMLLCSATTPLWNLLEGGARAQDKGAAIGLIVSGLISLAIGMLLRAHGRRAMDQPLGRREAILVVALVWVACGLFGGLPYVIDAGMSPDDAFFEAVSGFTTTGATVISDIEGTISRPTLLWRALTQWLGGMGIIVLFVAVFPSIGVGGKHLFRSEVPGPVAGGLRPRIRETSLVLWRLYGLFTLIQVLLLKLFGMSWFESVCHAFTTMSTGGFSTLDSSLGGFDADRVGYWNSIGIEWTVVIFMFLAGVNFALYYGAIRYRTLKTFWRSTEFKVYLWLCIGSSLALWGFLLVQAPSWEALFAGDWAFQQFRDATFMVATTVTSTGFGTSGYVHYPPAALTIMLLLMFVGASAGSTAGGIKVSRLILLVKLTWGQLRRSFRPNVVHVVRMGRKAVDQSVIMDVAAFFLIYMLCIAIGVLLVSTSDGVSVPKAFGAMLTSVSNMGPGPFHNIDVSAYVDDPSDNFSGYSWFAKYVFSLTMILGRLEFFTLLALLLPDFWRR
ncbi:MAG: TrkH family potassium uptake protein [Myxococcota bacterium]